MQTCVKDGKVTMVMSYEEWIEMAEILHYTLDRPDGLMRNNISKQIFDDVLKLDLAFKDIIQKELVKVPSYLKTIIRETQEEIQPPIPFKKGAEK